MCEGSLGIVAMEYKYVEEYTEVRMRMRVAEKREREGERKNKGVD